MFQLISWHLARLVGFSERQTRKPFWLWTALVVGLGMIAMMLVMVPMMVEAITRIERFAAEHPDQVTRTVGPGSYSVRIEGNHPELMPDFGGLVAGVGFAALISIVLLAAPVVRRLHDCGRTGLWGLIPAAFLLSGMVGMSQLFAQLTDGGEPPFTLFFGLFLNNLVYLASLGVLIYMLAQPGTVGENRFGPPPSAEPMT
jgi:uncharacterized membrane protein YhaH (DUF805 family)